MTVDNLLFFAKQHIHSDHAKILLAELLKKNPLELLTCLEETVPEETVEIYKKDERSLKFYFVKGEDLLPIGFDLTKNAFTQSTIDDKNIISCTYCYYDVEEI